MKNSSLKNKLQMQKQELKAPKNIFTGEKKKAIEEIQIGRKETELAASRIANRQENNFLNNIENKQNFNSTDLRQFSAFSILPSTTDINRIDEQQPLIPKKKRSRNSGGSKSVYARSYFQTNDLKKFIRMTYRIIQLEYLSL